LLPEQIVSLYITRLCAWAPGIESPGEWDEWAQGRRKIVCDAKSPAIAFTDPLFRRRLSQISKMTVQVVHGLLPVEEDTKIFFVSFRGELARQYQINKMLIEEKSLMPAAFSLSVFNAPAALASIALGLKGGYSALYPGNSSFAAALSAAEASFPSETPFPKETPALSSVTGELIFVYADEQPPPEYGRYFNECPFPLAFAFLLTREPQSLSVPLSSLKAGEDDYPASPLDFLRRLLLCGKIYVSC
jgi:hypothetical protein